MKLSDIKTLTEVSEYYKIPLKTLQSRLKNLVENEDYKRLGHRQPTILSPEGIIKIKGVLSMRRILDLLIGLNLEQGKELLSKESKIVKEDTTIEGTVKDYMFYINSEDYFMYTTEINEDEEEVKIGYWAIMEEGNHITNVGR